MPCIIYTRALRKTVVIEVPACLNYPFGRFVFGFCFKCVVLEPSFVKSRLNGQKITERHKREGT